MNYSRKDLEDLYSGVAGKPVVPRKHLRVLGEDDQLALPGVGAEGKPVLKKHLPSGYEKGDVHYAQDSLDKWKIGAMLLGLGREAKPAKGDSNAIRNILAITSDMIDRYPSIDGNTNDEIVSILSNIYQSKITEPLPINTYFNWVDFVKSNHPSYKKGIIDERFIYELSMLAGSGSVNVGSPEFAGILFLSDTAKANVGDLIRSNETYEVKAQSARMGDGAPDFALTGMKKVFEDNNLNYFEIAGAGGKQAWETLNHSIRAVSNDASLDETLKSKIIMDLVSRGTPKKEVNNKTIGEFEAWASNNFKHLLNPDNLADVYGALQILYYWSSDGHEFDYLWFTNTKLNSFIFSIAQNNTFTEVLSLVQDYINVNRLSSDSKFGAVGLTLN